MSETWRIEFTSNKLRWVGHSLLLVNAVHKSNNIAIERWHTSQQFKNYWISNSKEVAIYANEMVDHLKLYILPFTITENRENRDMLIGIDRH